MMDSEDGGNCSLVMDCVLEETAGTSTQKTLSQSDCGKVSVYSELALVLLTLMIGW